MIHFKHLQRRWLFCTLDFLGVMLMFLLAMFLRSSVFLPFFRGVVAIQSMFTWHVLVTHMITLGICFVIIQYIWGKYDLWASSSVLVWAKRLALPNAFLLALIFSYLYLLQQFDFPRSFVVTFCLLNFIYGLIWRMSYFAGVDREVSEIILVGGLKQLLPLAREFDFPPFVGKVKVQAIFTVDNAQQEKDIYPLAELANYSAKHNYSSIIIDPSEFSTTTLLQDLLNLANRNVPIYVLPSAYEILLGRLNHLQINDLPLLQLKLRSVSPSYALLKRGFDFITALLALLILAIPSAVIALIIKLTSYGSIIYSQQRVGLSGRVFRIYKFRSMVMDAEKNTGAVLASKRDRRITRFGRFLRKTRLDEIPQLINILLGDMSFVGPRPERPEFVEKFENEIPAYKERKHIRPGVTGLAQVSGNYESSPEIKLKYDLAYQVNQSILLDLQILLRTVKTILTKAGQ